jgi:hypothetical protein
MSGWRWPRRCVPLARRRCRAEAPHERRPQIGIGRVRHRGCGRRPTPSPTPPTSCCCRCAPAHAPGAALARNRFGLLAASTTATTATAAPTRWPGSTNCCSEGVADADGEVWLHTYPRVLGFAFKPVSFWYCHRADGSLAAIVAEVNNTFGERHCYLLAEPGLAWGRELRPARSSTCRRSAASRALPLPLHAHGRPHGGRIDHDDDDGPLLLTSVSGDLQPLTPRACTPRLLRHAADEPGRDRPHPLAGAAPVAQAGALLQQARSARSAFITPLTTRGPMTR